MLLDEIVIHNFRAIDRLNITLNERLTVLHGDNGEGKSSVLRAIAVGLGQVPRFFGVRGLNFHEDDRREVGGRLAGPAAILIGIKGIGTFARTTNWASKRAVNKKNSVKSDAPVNNAVFKDDKFPFSRIVNGIENNDPVEMPVFAFYGTDRVVIGLDRLGLPIRHRNFRTEFTRQGALDGALEGKTNFKSAFEWFYATENDELREQKERNDQMYQIPRLKAVRAAIESMIPEVSNPHVTRRPLHFMVRYHKGDLAEDLYLEQLSGGYRVMLALVVDLARRMGQANPHMENPLESEAIVLIDEVELHLHPSWQQRVLSDLLRTFPRTQFIVSTHSPQVLTTVQPENVFSVRNEMGGVKLYSTPGPTLGAEAGYVLQAEMNVEQRPTTDTGKAKQFVEELSRYQALIDNDQGEGEEALALRLQLEEVSPRDPALTKADAEIRRRTVLISNSVTSRILPGVHSPEAMRYSRPYRIGVVRSSGCHPCNSWLRERVNEMTTL